MGHLNEYGVSSSKIFQKTIRLGDLEDKEKKRMQKKQKKNTKADR